MINYIKFLFKYILKRISNSNLDKIRFIDGSYGNSIRYKYYKKRLKYLGNNVVIDTGVFIYGAEYVSIDDNTHIDKNCIIVGSSRDLDLSHRILKEREPLSRTICKGEVFIGKECHISQDTMIYGYGGVYISDNCVMSAGSKIYSLTSMPYNPYNKKEIISIVPYSGKSPTLLGEVVLGENVWVGINVVISPGVVIGKNSFVRSNSIVLDGFPENSYIEGDPAYSKRNRFEGAESQ
jgi:acetyltransferase-like isoleucine patch superfamily enzyme